MNESVIERRIANAAVRAYARRACGHKQAFKSAGAAEAAIRSLERRDLTGGGTLAAYFCPVCNHYHFGHRRGGRDA